VHYSQVVQSSRRFGSFEPNQQASVEGALAYINFYLHRPQGLRAAVPGLGTPFAYV